MTPPDPKTPEEILGEARREAKVWALKSTASNARKAGAIDHLAAVARLVGQVRQAEQSVDMYDAVATYLSETCGIRGYLEDERDRLLAELAGLEGKSG